MANTYLAIEHDLEIVPVINKIDLPSADPERVRQEIEDVIGIPAMDAPRDLRQDGHQHRAGAGDRSSRISPPRAGTSTPPCRR